MVYIIPYFLVLHFGENFIKFGSKQPKLQILIFRQFFMFFYGGQLKQLYTTYFLYVFNPFKMAVHF